MLSACKFWSGTPPQAAKAIKPTVPAQSLVSAHARRPPAATRSCRRPQPRRAVSDDIVDAGHRPLDMGLDPLAVSEPVLSPLERVVLDERPAEEFFELPRIGVANTDAEFEHRITALYRRVLGPLCGGDSSSASSSGPSVFLDLCSSWTCHLPADLLPAGQQVIGHGMNAAELAANRALTSSFLQDLNHTTRLQLPSGSVRAVLCCNGLQYLTRPEWVMAEARRVLQPGGVVVVSFSDCCWAERATAGWLARGSGQERLQLVARVLESAGLVVVERVIDDGDFAQNSSSSGSNNNNNNSNNSGSGGDNNNINSSTSSGSNGGKARSGRGDPLFAVVAVKPAAKGKGGREPPVISGGAVGITADVDPGEAATAYVGPALQEMDHQLLSGLPVTSAVLERWRLSYDVLIDDARELGIPGSAIPALPAAASADEIRAARDHLRSMIASFLSAGL